MSEKKLKKLPKAGFQGYFLTNQITDDACKNMPHWKWLNKALMIVPPVNHTHVHTGAQTHTKSGTQIQWNDTVSTYVKQPIIFYQERFIDWKKNWLIRDKEEDRSLEVMHLLIIIRFENSRDWGDVFWWFSSDRCSVKNRQHAIV